MKKIISSFLALVIIFAAFTTTSISAETPAQNGELVNYTYKDENNYSYLTLKESAVVTFYFTQPVNKNGEKLGVDLYFCYVGGEKDGKRYPEYDHISENSTKNEYSFTYFLNEGSYKFNLQLTSPYDINAPITTSYKISYIPADDYKIKTPKITCKLMKKRGIVYKVLISWEDDLDYDYVRLYNRYGFVDSYDITNYDTGKRRTSIISEYYSENVGGFKICMLKSGIGFDAWSDFSNLILFKIIDKPKVKFSKVNKKPTVTITPKLNEDNAKAKRYQIYRSTKKKSGYKKIKVLSNKKVKWTDKSAKANKTYYYKVRSYKNDNGYKLISKFTKPYKVKVN